MVSMYGAVDKVSKVSVSLFAVRDYSATGLGITDDLPFIQNAIAAAQAAGGGVVFFAEGTYLVSTMPQVTSPNVTIRGCGDGSVILLAPASLNAGGTTIGMWVNGTSHVLIEDMCFDGNFANIAKDGGVVVPSTWGPGAQLTVAVLTAPAQGTSENWSVNTAAATASAPYAGIPFCVLVDSEQVVVTAGQGTTSWTVRRGFAGTTPATHANGAPVGPTNGVLFDAVIAKYGISSPKNYQSSQYFGGIDASTYLLQRMPVRVTNCDDVEVRNCLFRNSISAGALVDATSVGGCTDVRVHDNRVSLTWDNGIYFHKGAAHSSAIDNDVSDTMYNGGCAVFCDHVNFLGNDIRNAGPSFSDSGGIQLNGASACLVEGNEIDNCQFYGVEAEATNETNITGGAGGNLVYASNNEITGNVITNCNAADFPTHTSSGVNVFGASATKVSDNTIRGCDFGISVGSKATGTHITDDNRITNCKSLGINVGNSADVINTLIKGNFIGYNGSHGVLANAPVRVEGNVIAGNIGMGVNLGTPPSGLPHKIDYVIANTIYDNTDSGVLVGGGSTSLAVVKRNEFLNSSGVLFTDGVANTSTSFSSATANFTAADVGRTLIVLNQGTSGTTTATTILSVTNSTTVVLASATAATETGLTFWISRGPGFYADGSTTTAANSVLNSATAAFTASDVGELVIITSLDPVPALLGVTTVASLISATQVTLAANVGTIAACGFFINRSQGQTGKAINNFAGNPLISEDNFIYGIPEYQGPSGIVPKLPSPFLRFARRAVADSNYSVQVPDQLVVMTSMTAARTITLPNGLGTATQPYYVDIKDESGTAWAHNITLTVSGGGTIDGAASLVLGENYGQVRVYSTGTNWYTMATQRAAPVNVKPANPAATTSLSLVMMGLGSSCVYTPKGSGTVMVTVTAFGNIATNPTGVGCGPRYGTGTAPANGVAVTGTRFGGTTDPGSRPGGTGSGAGVAFAFTDLLALTPGTTYWFDLALLTSTSTDAASLINVSMTFVELP